MKVAWVLLALVACGERSQPRDEPAPAVAPIPTPPPMRDIDEIGDPTDPVPADSDWSTRRTCAVQGSELIYVLDSGSRLMSFDPRKLPDDPFHLVGTLRCARGSSPNSMAIDRKGIAWIGYQNGKMYRASIVDAKCDPAGWRAPGASRTFGMGYVTDGPKTEKEQLFVAGGDDDPRFTLGVIDTTDRTWRKVANQSVKEHAELTGTSEGRLFAYYPAPGRGFVQEIDRDKATGIGPKWRIPGDPFVIDSYAFAHFGGVFYVFTTADGVSSVHAVHMQTGKVERVRNNLRHPIVGAGVSTCAPLLEAP